MAEEARGGLRPRASSPSTFRYTPDDESETAARIARENIRREKDAARKRARRAREATEQQTEFERAQEALRRDIASSNIQVRRTTDNSAY